MSAAILRVAYLYHQTDTTMSSITLKNDRKRRRQARTITFIITTATLVGTAYLVGATDQLVELVQHLFATAAGSEPVA